MTGGCITLTNLGMYPIESFDPIIFPEHSSILAVGAVQKKPVVLNDSVAIRSMATVKVAVDHRLINGRTAAEFICKVKEIMEAVISDE
jgi:pyruvate dehydrogenase E2 component (dihydrolipoamide acetyltransferase)